MRTRELVARIEADRADGFAPFLVVGTAGSTSAGAVDPLADLAEVAEREGLWFHVDAAWGGAAALVPELRPLLAGIERSGSLTFDAHKFLSVPMGAGLYLTRHSGVLDRTFRVAAGYMPGSGKAGIVDPYAHSMQWSRRFIGLKLFLSLAVAGWRGYEEVIRHQVAMGQLLRQRLDASGWQVINDTPLPLVCFTRRAGATAARLEAVAAAVTASGEAWLNSVPLGSGTALRACITSYRTAPADIDSLIDTLGRAWESCQTHPNPPRTTAGEN
jgi:aromatic-L-amino-acid decarboxylase